MGTTLAVFSMTGKIPCSNDLFSTIASAVTKFWEWLAIFSALILVSNVDLFLSSFIMLCTYVDDVGSRNGGAHTFHVTVGIMRRRGCSVVSI